MKGSFRKTAAFVLALTLVAGTMPANVGGFLTGSTGITANAAPPTSDSGGKPESGLNIAAAVTGVQLNKTETNLTAGSTETLTATVSPDNAANKNVTWSSSNTDVATVDENGKVTAVGAGSATIKATATNGTDDTIDDKADYCTVIVKYPFTAESITIDDITYDGEVKTPVLKYGDTVLRDGTDYILDEKVGDIVSATDAGTYTFSASGRNDYAGENVELTWTIAKAPVSVTPADNLTYTGEAQNLISGDVPAGTKFTLTEPKAGLDFAAESDKISGWGNTLVAKGQNASSQASYYYNAASALYDYESALYYLNNKDESEAAYYISSALNNVRSMAQYNVEPSDDVKEAIDYINTYIKDTTLEKTKARFETVEPDDWSDTVSAAEVGEYTVYYKGDGVNYDDTVRSVVVTVNKAAAGITNAPTAADDLTYNGTGQALLATPRRGKRRNAGVWYSRL